MAIIQPKKDYTKEVEEILKNNIKTTWNDENEVNEAISAILAIEKKTRLANDLENSKKLVRAVLQIQIDLKNWIKLGEIIESICKRHAQLKMVVAEIIKTGMNTLSKIMNEETKLTLLKMLRELCKGKMHVELEYSRMTMEYSKIQESQGKIENACEVLHEVHPETISSMAFAEKFEYLLEQLRLSLQTGAKIRAELTASKFNLDLLEKKKCDNEAELKRRYFALIAKFHLGRSEYLKVAQSYLQLHVVCENDKNLTPKNLQLAALYSAIAEDSNELQIFLKKFLHERRKDLSNKDSKAFRKLLMLRVEERLVKWPLEKAFLSKLSVVQSLLIGVSEEKVTENRVQGKSDIKMDMKDDDEVTMKSNGGLNLGKPYISLLGESFSRHNIKVVSKNYSVIELGKISKFANLSIEETEDMICKMVQKKKLVAKINRPNKSISFGAVRNSNQRLEDWSNVIQEVLFKMQRVCHLIEKDILLHSTK